MLNKWLELKAIENEAKEKRIQLEEEIWNTYLFSDEELSHTFNEDDIKLTIKRNIKYKLSGKEVPENVDIYKKTVDENKLKKYSGEDWVEVYENKPTFTVVRVR